MSVWSVGLVAVSGFAAGAVNAVAGGGTLVAFPALLATGMAARTANIVSTIGLVPGYAGGSLAYRRELQGQGPRLRSLALTSVVGGLAGAVILVSTPASAFRVVVPFLILGACGALALQPRLARIVAARQADPRRAGTRMGWGVQTGVLLSAVYGSYFGAGLGILLLGILGIALHDGMQRLNALKGLLSFVINVVSVAVFAVAGHVSWTYTAILAVTAWAGGGVGVGVARRLSPNLLRAVVVALGVGVAITLMAQT